MKQRTPTIWRSPRAVLPGRCTPAGRAASKGGVLFRAPRKLDYMKLVPIEAVRRTALQHGRCPGHALRQQDSL
jgi:hypothetical protein